jgi:uncharacterized membrane protein
MNNKRLSMFKSFTRACAALLLVITLVFSQAGTAMAARTGGGFGGGSFSRPMPRMSSPRMAPRSGPSSYGYPGGGYGGGFGFPFMLPFFFGGGGSLFSILIFIAIANFLFSAFRNASSSEGGISDQDLTNPPTSINTLQIGLLSQARSLQTDLDRIALTANTSSSAGLAEALQETTLTLLRHPEYWVYGSSEGQQTRLLSAETEFNRRTLSERGKFQEETLSNYGALRQKSATAILPASNDTDAQLAQAPGEYIVVTLIVASQGKLDLPQIQSAEDVQRSLGQLGAVGTENLLAMRVLWTPQADGDTLSAEDVVEAYPTLRRL